jgi:hypothetical protein
MDNGAFFSQNSGGPRNVTEIQAAVVSGISNTRLKSEGSLTYLQRSEDTRPTTLKPHHRSGEGG